MLVHAQREFLVGLLYPALLQHAPQRCTLLITERIGAQMLHIQCQSLAHIGLPLLHRLRGQSVDEVYTHIADAVPGCLFHSANGLLRGVAATYKAKQSVVKTLHAHAQAVDGRMGERCKPLGSHVIGIGLHSNLGIGIHREEATNLVENAGQRLDRQLAGCSAAYIYRMYARERQFITAHAQLCQECINIARLPFLPFGGGIEVAIDASPLAEGDVYVYAGHALSHASPGKVSRRNRDTHCLSRSWFPRSVER